MHHEAMQHAKLFFDIYSKNFSNPTIIEIGSKNVNGSIRVFAPTPSKYIGLDFDPGNDVDIVITDPYHLPIEDNTADILVTSSCFEHSQFFWLSFLEALRITKPNGLIYINAPSGGVYHRYPTDNWRFYPDAGLALKEWGFYSGYTPSLLESFIGFQDKTRSNDFVTVLVKDEKYEGLYLDRMYAKALNPTNVLIDNSDKPFNISAKTQNERQLEYAIKNLYNLKKFCSHNKENTELVEIEKFLTAVIDTIPTI